MQFYRKYIFLSSLFFILLFYSCEIINPEETIPSYLQIDTIKLETSGNGSNSSKISDAWVYIDDQPIGAYELPAKFPVLVQGQHKVFIKAGIKVNGISETRGAYPFFEGYTSDVNFVKDSVVIIKPIVYYYSIVQFVLNEDFESSGILFEKTERSDTVIEKTIDIKDVFDGDYSGIVHLTAAKELFECKSIEAFKLPLGNKPIYLELNYKSDITFTVGFFANVSQNSIQHAVFNVNKTDVWNKIYINYTEAISRYPDAYDFYIFIGATLPEGQSEATLHLDNIRLIHN